MANTIEKQKEKIPNIKYIITLDADTDLILKTASKLIGAMSHILNTPIIKEDRVIQNLHTLIQNNGKDFNLTKEQLELANMLT